MCNVSVSTVSKAMNDRADVSSAKKEEIRKVAKEMNYVPNYMASALKNQYTRNIGVILSEDTGQGLMHEHFARILNSFKDTVEERGYVITFLNSSNSPNRFSYMKQCQYMKFDGVFIVCADYHQEEVRELLASNIHVVVIDHTMKRHVNIASNQYGDMRRLLQFVFDRGHRKIAYMHGKNSEVTRDRLLAYRNPEVRKYATSVIDRLIRDYGIGYIKMDYNIEPGIGTEYQAENPGEGLLEHERAYLKWLDGIFEKYPELVIENCSSGGLRMDYAMLSRYSIQSTSDEEDYRYYATIAANAPSGLTPEQAAVWSYPLPQGDREEVVFNMVNAMLLRVHQSGHLNVLSQERKDLVKEGLDYYKKIRHDIKEAVPFWPLGLSQFNDEWVSLGLRAENKIYLAVWRRSGSQRQMSLPLSLSQEEKEKIQIRLAYPSYSTSSFAWNPAAGTLTVELENENMARLFEITL